MKRKMIISFAPSSVEVSFDAGMTWKSVIAQPKSNFEVDLPDGVNAEDVKVKLDGGQPELVYREEKGSEENEEPSDSSKAPTIQ